MIHWRLTAAALFVFFLCSCEDRSGVTQLKLAHGLDVNHPVHEGMVFMADQVKEKSDGKMEIEIYPSSQLGSERQLLELLQIGSLDITKVSAAVIENFAPNLLVLSLPYVFRDKEHHFTVLDGPIGSELLLQGEKYWLRGLTFFDAGYRSFYSKEKPIQSPGDLEGMKIRVQESQTAMGMVRAMGGAPTPISWGELYTALQQGVVDGAENNPPSFYTSRHYEVCKYYVLNEHTAVPDILVVGTVAWERLDEQEREWLQEAADEARDYQRILWKKAEEKALAAVQEAGVEVIYPEKKPFAEAVESMYEQYRSEGQVYELIQRIRAVPSGSAERKESSTDENEN